MSATEENALRSGLDLAEHHVMGQHLCSGHTVLAGAEMTVKRGHGAMGYQGLKAISTTVF